MISDSRPCSNVSNEICSCQNVGLLNRLSEFEAVGFDKQRYFSWEWFLDEVDWCCGC